MSYKASPICDRVGAIGRRLKHHRRAWLAVVLGLAVGAYCFVQGKRRTVHSFRIAGSGPQVLVTLKKGGAQFDTSLMTDGEHIVLDDIKDALVRLDSGKATVYSPLRPEPVRLELPSTLEPVGAYMVDITRIRERLVVVIGGAATSIRYSDQTLGSKKSVRKYGSELVPSVLEEQRNGGLAAAGVMFAVLQFLYLLRELFRK